jgi:hypothetical protein
MSFKTQPKCLIGLDEARCRKCAKDRHKCQWNGEVRAVIGTGRNSGEIVAKRSRPDLAKEAKSSDDDREGKLFFVT